MPTNAVIYNIVNQPSYGPTDFESMASAAVLSFTVNKVTKHYARSRQTALNQKMGAIQAVGSEWARRLQVHQVPLTNATGPVLPPSPQLPSLQDLIEQDLKRRGKSGGKFRGPSSAEVEISRTSAQTMLTSMQYDAELAKNSAQIELDAIWKRLVQNDPEVVASVLALAFSDNEFATRVLDVAQGCAVVEVVVPSLERAIPLQRVGTGRKGDAKIVNATKTERRRAYRQYILGGALLTVRETFAVAPAIKHVDCSVLTVASKAGAVAGSVPKGLGRVFLTRHAAESLNLSLPADEILISRCSASRLSFGRNGELAEVPLEYVKSDKVALTKVIDPGAATATLQATSRRAEGRKAGPTKGGQSDASPNANLDEAREAIGRAASDMVSKSLKFGAKGLRRLSESDAVRNARATSPKDGSESFDMASEVDESEPISENAAHN